MTKKLDYDRLADDYFRHRQIHPEVLADLSTIPNLGPRDKVLEIGCGSGNYISVLNSQIGCKCYGQDPSAVMLSRAQERCRQGVFKRGHAEHLNFKSDFFDLVFSVDVIHHVEDRSAFFNEAFRSLKPGGRICTVTDSEWIIRHRQPLATYFPETVEVELARYPRISELIAHMIQSGFTDPVEKAVEFPYQLKDIQAYRDKSYSCLHLISPQAHQTGVAHMERDLLGGPLDCKSMYSILWAVKPLH